MTADAPQLPLRAVLTSPAVEIVVRLAVTAPFLVSGILKLVDLDGAAAEVRGLTGLEPAWLFAGLVIAVQLGGSALIFISRWSWLGAGLLAGFTALATLLAHAFWAKPIPEQMLHLNIFFEHVSIVGGLVLVAVHDAWRRR